MTPDIEFAVFLAVEAKPRYWEDATVNGVEDEDGSRIPLRKGELWCPVINIADGTIRDWPLGTVADVHYKVCDEGKYFLTDAQGNRIAKYASDYVPTPLLSPLDHGYGDYIILEIDGDGRIDGWNPQRVSRTEWKAA